MFLDSDTSPDFISSGGGEEDWSEFFGGTNVASFIVNCLN